MALNLVSPDDASHVQTDFVAQSLAVGIPGPIRRAMVTYRMPGRSSPIRLFRWTTSSVAQTPARFQVELRAPRVILLCWAFLDQEECNLWERDSEVPASTLKTLPMSGRGLCMASVTHREAYVELVTITGGRARGYVEWEQRSGVKSVHAARVMPVFMTGRDPMSMQARSSSRSIE